MPTRGSQTRIGRTRRFIAPLAAALAVAAFLPGIVGRAVAPVFADNFETGNLLAWSETSGFVAQQQQVFGGVWAGRATVSGAPGYVSKTLSSPLPDVYLDTRVNVLSSSGTTRLLRMRTAAGGGLVSLRISTSGKLTIRNDVTGTVPASSTKMTKGAWHELQLHVLVNGASSAIEVWLDAVRISGLSFTTSLGTTPVGRVQVGNNSSATMDVVYDDVIVADALVTGDVTPPTVPQDLRTTSIAGNRVDLEWSASTDDTDVAGYGVYRGGTLIGSVPGSQTSFSDTSVTPLTTYSYTVDAVDPGNNRSAQSSPPLDVTTPTTDTTPPMTPTGLEAVAIGPTTVDLQWQPSNDDVGVTGYTIYRDGGEIGSTIGSGTMFTDTTAQPATTHTYEVDAVDAAGNHSGRSSPAEATTPAGTVLVAAGDICPTSPADCAGTAALVLASDPDVALTLGDNQYESGTLAEYLASYDLQWGTFKGLTKPSPGNHEWKTLGAQGYKDYFGTSFLTNGGTWYSFDLSGWHIVSIDSQCSSIGGCGTTSVEYAWLQQDLATDNHTCTLAYWHKPRFSSGTVHGSNTAVGPFWNLLDAEGAEIVLNGHEHHYELFGPQTPGGVASATGIRQIVVGTGGNCCYGFGTPVANSEVRITDTRGILELTLGAASYSWRFIAVGGAVLDSGTGTCH